MFIEATLLPEKMTCLPLIERHRSFLSDEIINWRVDPHHFWLAPAAWGPSPPPGMALLAC